MAIANPVPEFKNPVTVTSAFGRFFYAVNSTVYFSQILTSGKVAGKCYQANDPTSDQNPDLLATDGGVIVLDSAVKITALQPFRLGVLVFAENGVWYIYDPDGGFKATGFNVSKITERGIESPKSVVSAEGSVLYFSDNGIMSIVANEFDNLTAQDITESTIRTYYIENFLGKGCTGSYDSQNKTIQWWTQGGESLSLFLDLRANSFYPQKNSSLVGIGRSFKVLNDFLYASWQDSETSYQYSVADLTDNTFKDFSVDQEAFLVTGYETLGKFAHKKAITSCMTMFEKTETQILGYADGQYTYDQPSSCFLQARWDFDGSNAFSKWVGSTPTVSGTGKKMQMYNPMRRGFIPDSYPYTFDTGETIIHKRQKIRGNGKAVQLRFEAEAEKDMKLLGYTVSYTMRGKY